MRLTMIAVEHPLGFLSAFAGHILIIPFNIAIRFPNVFAGLLVERNCVLQIDSVEREDHEVVEQHDGRRRPAIVTTFQIVALPENIAGGRVDARGAVAAEVCVKAAWLNRWRRGRVAIHVVPKRLWRITVEQLLIVYDFSRRLIDAQDRKVVAIFGRGRKPDLAVHYDGGRPTETWNRG